MRFTKRLSLAVSLIAGLVCAGASAQQNNTAREPDILFLPTPQSVVDAMLKMAGVHAGDVVYDLGSGDGRIVVTAAKQYGVRGVGIDIDPRMIAEANENAARSGVAKLVTFRNGDLFDADINEASVVTLYLLGPLNLKLRPKLWRDLKPGTRIVSQTFDMGDWKPEKEEQIDVFHIYLWRIPEGAARKK